MKKIVELLAVGTCLVWLVLQWGPAAFNQWQMDGLVDRLCAMDGRVIVYEPVPIPARGAVDAGTLHIPFKPARTGVDPYYYENETVPIYAGSDEAGDITVHRHHDRLIRAVDDKMLAERVAYVRQYGDRARLWRPADYACPVGSIDDLNRKVFLRGQEPGS